MIKYLPKFLERQQEKSKQGSSVSSFSDVHEEGVRNNKKCCWQIDFKFLACKSDSIIALYIY